jgi:hypothetical protein
MRLDTSQEPEFASLFKDDSDSQKPFVVILNPGKRKRFLKHEGDITTASITKTLDKILGGDAKFKPVKEN